MTKYYRKINENGDEQTLGAVTASHSIYTIDTSGFTMTKPYSSSWLTGWRYIAVKN